MNSENLYIDIVNNPYINQMVTRQYYNISNPYEYQLDKIFDHLFIQDGHKKTIKTIGNIDFLFPLLSPHNINFKDVSSAIFVEQSTYETIKSIVVDFFEKSAEKDIFERLPSDIKDRLNYLNVTYKIYSLSVYANCYVDEETNKECLDFNRLMKIMIGADALLHINIDHHELNRLKFNETFYNKIYTQYYQNWDFNEVYNSIGGNELYYQINPFGSNHE